MTALSLTEFLLARIDEDEAAARAATQGTTRGEWTAVGTKFPDEDNWHPEEMESGYVVVFPDALAIAPADEGEIYGHDAYHIARHDPARVLAECETKRRLLTEIDEYEQDRVQSLLALPYTDHPAYDEAWRP